MASSLRGGCCSVAGGARAIMRGARPAGQPGDQRVGADPEQYVTEPGADIT